MKRKRSPEEARAYAPLYPAVLVSCARAAEGAQVQADILPNIISIGMCTLVSFSPPLIMISVGKTRYSNNIIRDSGEFVVNIPTPELEKKVRFCGSTSGRDTDKFSESGLTKEKAEKVKAPLIKECPVNIECTVVNEVEAGDHTLFIGEVAALHAEESFSHSESLLYKGGVFYSPKSLSS